MNITTLNDLATHLGIVETRLQGGKPVPLHTHPQSIAIAVERVSRGRAVLSTLSRATYRRPVTRRFRLTASILGYTVQVQNDLQEWVSFNAAEDGCLAGQLADRAAAALGLTHGKVDVPGHLAFPSPADLASRITSIPGGEWTATVNPAAPGHVIADWHTFDIRDVTHGSTYAVELADVDATLLFILPFPFDSEDFDAYIEAIREAAAE